MPEEESGFLASIVIPMLQTIHFYTSLMVGWWVFHTGVYPLAYFSKGAGADLAVQLPVYAINVMAFGCMTYVATRPWILLISYLIQSTGRRLEKI